MVGSEKNLHLLIQLGRVKVSWLISWSKIRKLRRLSASELGKKEDLRGTRMRLNITCKSLVDITRTVSDTPLVELTMTRMKGKSCEKASSRVESTQHLAQTSQSVTMMMSRAM